MLDQHQQPILSVSFSLF